MRDHVLPDFRKGFQIIADRQSLANPRLQKILDPILRCGAEFKNWPIEWPRDLIEFVRAINSAIRAITHLSES
jgi:hypothetical protein